MADARNISVPRGLVACLAVTVLLLGTIIMPAAQAQELDGQTRGVVVNARSQPSRDQIAPFAELERRVNPGAEVFLTDREGLQAHARLLRAGATENAPLVGREERQFDAAAIGRVERRDPLWNVDQLSQPTPRSATIPSGTIFEVLLDHQLSTQTDRVGDTFRITLARSVVIDKRTVLAEGTPLLGQIVDLTPAWQKTGRLTLVLHELLLQDAGGAISIQSEPLKLDRKRGMKDYAIAGGICAASFAAAVILGRTRQPSGSGEGPEGYLAIGGCALGGVAYDYFRSKDLVLAPRKKLVFRLIGDLTLSFSPFK